MTDRQLFLTIYAAAKSMLAAYEKWLVFKGFLREKPR